MLTEKGSLSTAVQEPAPPGTTEPTDGGAKAWLTTIGGALVMFCVFGYTNAFGVFQDLYTQSGTSTASNISWIGSTQVFFMIALSLPVGKLVDLGYFRHILFVGSVLYSFFVFMLSLAHPDKYYQLFLIQGLGMGLSGGLLYLPAVAIQARHWKRRRSLAMGIVFGGSSTGGIIFPIMLNQLIHNGSVDFAWAVRASGFLILGLLIIANLIMDLGAPVPPPSIESSRGLRAMMRDIPYLLVTLGAFFVNLGFYFPYFYVQLFAIDHGVDQTLSFYFLSIISAGSVIGRVAPNFLADLVGPMNNFVPACLGTSILLFGLLGILSTAGLIVFSILYGFFTGGVISLIAPAIAVLTVNPGEIGLRMGATFFVLAFGTLAGTPIQGALLGSQFIWWRAIVCSAVFVLAGTLTLFIARVMISRRRGTQRV